MQVNLRIIKRMKITIRSRRVRLMKRFARSSKSQAHKRSLNSHRELSILLIKLTRNSSLMVFYPI